MATLLQAQVDTGTILGTVRDASGAVVPGVKVTISNEGTLFTQTTTTSASGNYVFTPLRIGTYTIAVEQPGFKKERRTGQQLNIQQQLVVDFILQPGEVSTTVDVTGQAPVLQTENGSVGQVVGTQSVNDLPLNGRNYTFLARLTAGVNPGQPEGRGLNANGWFEANGTRADQNNYMLDGIDNNSNSVDFLSGAAYVLKPPIDALAEFKLQTNSFSAEFGRAGGAVLNASLKSGTNEFHGSLWEFLRNDALDAADFFENATGSKKGAFRQNQFGATLGGPIFKNKTFFFGDYEGTRIRQQVPETATVPTQSEISSGYTNFSDLVSLQSGQLTDATGKSYPLGTIFDPGSTTSIGNGQYVRTPFPGNTIPASRMDPNSLKLMQLFPAPTQGGLYNNYNVNRSSSNDVNAVDGRVDEYFTEHDQMFARYSWSHNPQFIPGPFSGYADGGGFGDGDQQVDTMGAALSYTHSFSPTLVNEARVGFNREHTSRVQPYGNDTSNIPGQFGIEGVLQTAGNGGLPYLGIGGLSQLGSAEWLISDRYSNTVQFTENLTKIYGKHTFKAGVEIQQVGFPWEAPPYSRGAYDFNGQYTSIPNVTDNSTGRAQFLLAPTPGGIGGPDNVSLSNFGGVAAQRAYRGAFAQDDWKVTPKLTLNLGVRWDYFTPTGEKYGAQANFVPGTPFSGAEYIIPNNRQNNPALSASFVQTLQQDGINLVYSSGYGGSGLANVQKTNFAPRFGFAYKATDHLVIRGGYGMFYGAFENRGGYPSLGYNYPFQYSFYYFAPNSQSPMVLPNGQNGTLENSLAGIPLDPTLVAGPGLTLRGIQLNYKTPYVQSFNVTLQYQFTPSTTIEAGYVGSLSRHLETFVGTNNPSVLLPPGTSITPYIPFPDFSPGSPYDDTIGTADFHSLQTKLERRFSKGLSALVVYTYSKTLTDAGDLLSGGGVGGFRAPDLPGFGIQGDWGLAPFDIRHSFVASGTYDLPFGHGRTYLSSSSKLADAFLGGWSFNWILTLHSGNPQTIGCTIPTGADNGCYALYTGQPLYQGQSVTHFYNAAAFTNPGVVTQVGQSNYAPLGGGNTQVAGPSFHRLDFSLFKSFPITEQKRFEFRVEAFNLTNTPNFALPSNLNFLNTVNFGQITSTVDNPNDPRELQLALKFYF
ncbi:MAG TPA: carboxypeptidase-like regulatory domain-containing protein [Bryobacteraceae bacterium]|nr:carboxypeptidase-like regulatory domain-containing protein [Bryobacteraceae bacterium]